MLLETFQQMRSLFQNPKKISMKMIKSSGFPLKEIGKQDKFPKRATEISLKNEYLHDCKC
jgi:hypothetical protein